MDDRKLLKRLQTATANPNVVSVVSPCSLFSPTPPPIILSLPHTCITFDGSCLIVLYLLSTIVCPIDPDLHFCYYLRHFIDLLLFSLGFNTVIL